MKVNRILAAAVMTLGLLSCKGESPKEAPQKKMDFPVSISIEGNKGAMRAAQKGTSLTGSYANERAIENLTVVVFKLNTVTNEPDAVEKVIPYEKLTKPTGATPYDGTYQFDMLAAGNYQIDVIANGYKEGDVSAQNAFLGMLQKKPLPYNEYKKLLIERVLPKNGESGFVMLNADPIKVTTSQNQTANAGSIKLRRLACRFDVFNKLVGGELVLTKATLQKQISKSYLLTQTAIPAGTDSEVAYTANGKWFTGTVISGGIYSYENPTKGATKLVLEGTYKDTPWKKTIEFKDGGQDIAIQRNHIYRVYLTKGTGVTPGGDDSNANLVNYNIEVLDWEAGDEFAYTDGDVWSAGEETFTQYTFAADRTSFGVDGGTGHVTCTQTIYAGKDATGRVLSKKQLPVGDFTLRLKSAPQAGVTVDDATKSFTVPAGAGQLTFTLEAKHNTSGVASDIVVRRGMNPLAYVAEYNIGNDFNSFATDLYSPDVSEYYSPQDVRFSSLTIDGKKYHLPSIEEWRAIIPNGIFQSSFENLNSSAPVIVAGKNVTCLQDVKGFGEGVIYALRFKGTEYQSAWRYEYVNVNNYIVLRITSRDVADGVTIADVAKKDFWTQNSTADIVRIIPASGYLEYTNSTIGYKTTAKSEYGMFFSSTKPNLFWFSREGMELNTGSRFQWDGSYYLYTVRLFKDEL